MSDTTPFPIGVDISLRKATKELKNVFLSEKQIEQSIRKLDDVNPFFGSVFLSFKEIGLPVRDSWFIIHFPSLQMKLGENLKKAEAESVTRIIKRLKLNDETYIRGRRSWLEPCIMGKYDIDYLEENAPFLACELRRQNIADIHHAIWEDFKKYPQNY
ncbi:MAG: hypothetical protein H0V70_22820 [Ktedonobacteraceae bacterium]|nr:hypothetical protein [Ktedonobacteraceae bacterium]